MTSLHHDNLTRSEALEILELDPNCKYDTDQIKKQYRLLALQYHPDKCREEYAKERFLVIKSAYEFLMANSTNPFYNMPAFHETPETNPTSEYMDRYDNVLELFLSRFVSMEETEGGITAKILSIIIRNIAEYCTNRIQYREYLKRINRTTAIKMYGILQAYKSAFHISDELLETVRSIIETELEDDECIILNPSLDDMLNEKIYVLKHGGQSFLVPLWHQDMTYSFKETAELHVKCFPVLPEGVELDQMNNIYYRMRIPISEIFGKPKYTVCIGDKEYWFSPDKLKLTDAEQQIHLMGSPGIPYANLGDTFDVSVKQQVYLLATLCL